MSGEDLVEYLELFRVLERHGVRYVIVGGLAVQYHGVIRSTEDADVVPDPSRQNLEALSQALRELEAHLPGDDPAGPDPLAPGTLGSGATLKYETRFGPFHLVQGQPGQPAWAELSSQASTAEIEGVTLPVCSYQHLVEMKTGAGRPQDEIDLADLRAARGEGQDQTAG